MTRPEPAAALNRRRTGHICDSCNRRVQTGDLVRIYATFYEHDGWVFRRLWCDDCGDTKIEQGTDGADEVIAEAVFWKHQLAGVKILDRSYPGEPVADS